MAKGQILQRMYVLLLRDTGFVHVMHRGLIAKV